MPMRTDAIHIVNQNWICDVPFKILKPFLNEKMRSRIFFHGSNMESLHQHIDKKHLPSKYGGYMDDYPYKTWMDNLVRDINLVDELRQLGYSLNSDDLRSYQKEL